jgi:hypothetical protein
MPIENAFEFFKQKLEEKKQEQIKQDLEYGLNMETKICPIIEKYFQVKLHKTSQFSHEDWLAENGTYFELKSRPSILPTTYSTQIFPVYKTKIGLTDATSSQRTEFSPLIIVYHFSRTNETFFIEYNKEKFSKYQTRMIEACRRTTNPIEHFEIPFTDFIKIT